MPNDRNNHLETVKAWLTQLDQAAISRHIQAVMLASAKRVNEFELLKSLLSLQLLPDPGTESRDYNLFLRHFMLRHLIYQLRLHWLGKRFATMAVDAFGFERAVYAYGEYGLRVFDRLQNFYLAQENIFQFSPDQMQTMLGDFWSFMEHREKRRGALAVLGLEDPVSPAAIRSRYRVLVMRHHPDRGGENHILQSINHAYTQLNA